MKLPQSFSFEHKVGIEVGECFLCYTSFENTSSDARASTARRREIVPKNLAFSSVGFMELPAGLYSRQQLKWSRHHQTWFQSGATVDLH